MIEAHRFVCHIMETIAYFWLKFKIYLEKVPVMANNTLSGDISFITMYVF